MLGERLEAGREAHGRGRQVIIVQGGREALGAGVRETRFLFDTCLHFKLHVWVGPDGGKGV